MNTLDKVSNKFGGTRYRNYVMIRCPYHRDSRPSMQVHADRAYCKACGKSVPTKQLLQPNIMLPPSRRNGKSKFSNPFTKWSLNGETLGEALRLAFQTNSDQPSHYLKKRGIDAEHQKKYLIGRRDNWLTFPIRDRRGKIVGATARAGEGNNSLAKYTCPSGQDPNLIYVPDWGLLEGATRVFLVFGIIDAVTLAVIGKPGMSTTTGLSLNSNALKSIRSDIIVIPDEGEQEAGYKLARSLGLRGKVLVPHYPVGSKDINDLFLYHPEELNVVQ